MSHAGNGICIASKVTPMKKLLLTIGICIAMAAPAFADTAPKPNKPDPELWDNPNLPPAIKRQVTAIKAHLDELNTITSALSVVDSIVVCNIKDANWGETYRPMVWRVLDGLARDIGLSAEAKYALRGDIEKNAHKLTIDLPCEKLNTTMADQFAALLTSSSK
jgi:hypothetical protein